MWLINRLPKDGKASQIIQEAQPLELPLIDLSLLAEDQRKRQLEETVNQNVLIPLNLAKDSLIQLILFRLKPEEYILYTHLT